MAERTSETDSTPKKTYSHLPAFLENPPNSTKVAENHKWARGQKKHKKRYNFYNFENSPGHISVKMTGKMRRIQQYHSNLISIRRAWDIWRKVIFFARKVIFNHEGVKIFEFWLQIWILHEKTPRVTCKHFLFWRLFDPKSQNIAKSRKKSKNDGRRQKHL